MFLFSFNQVLTPEEMTDLASEAMTNREGKLRVLNTSLQPLDIEQDLIHFERISVAPGGCCYDSEPHWKNKVYRYRRRRSSHKPYNPVDELNFDALHITSDKLSKRHIQKNVHSQTKDSTSEPSHPARKQLLLRPAKLKITGDTASETCDKSSFSFKACSTKETFDFGSLAAQVSVIESKTDSKNSHSFNWNKLRKSNDRQLTAIAGNKVKSTTSNTEENADKFEDLSPLGSLRLHSDLGAEAAVAHNSPRTASLVRSCSQEAMFNETDFSAEELASYFDELVYIPKKMSEMAEMMYT